MNAVVSTPVSRSKRIDNTSSNSLFSDEKEADFFSDEKVKDKSGSLARCKNLFSAQSDSDYSSPSKQVSSGTHLSLPGKLSTLGKVQSLSFSVCYALVLTKTNKKNGVVEMKMIKIVGNVFYICRRQSKREMQLRKQPTKPCVMLVQLRMLSESSGN